MLPAVADFYCPAPKKEAKPQNRQRSLRSQCPICGSLPPFRSLCPPTHSQARLQLATFVLSSPFADSICRLDSVDSDLSTRFCRLDYVDSSVDFENNSPQCRSAALGEAIATPISAARHRSEASKFFRKNAPLLCAFSRKNVRCLRPCRFLASKVLLSCYHRALLHCCIEYAIRRHISRPPNADTTQKKTCRR